MQDYNSMGSGKKGDVSEKGKHARKAPAYKEGPNPNVSVPKLPQIKGAEQKMPSYQRRKEEDARASRFESEVRASDLERMKGRQAHGEHVKMYMCSKCHRLFEDRSIVCPRCETKTMGELRPRTQI